MNTYRPLPYYLTIAKSDMLSAITGKDELGLFASEKISANTNMGITHVFDDRFEDGLIRTPLGGFFNHNSKDPNCRVIHGIEYIYLESLKDIEKGEEITAKYTLYNPEEK
jgi:hypothetical protein